MQEPIAPPIDVDLIRVVGAEQRQWATRGYRRFLGAFELDVASGIYFEPQTPAQHRQTISSTFVKLPCRLREDAISLGLTVSTTCASSTFEGHLSTVYGWWDATDPAEISPHLEMTTKSLSDELIVPHLTHEITHIFWELQSPEARAKYGDAMRKLVGPDFSEVTDYAQEAFQNWHKRHEGQHNPFFVNNSFKRWVIESLCETVGKLCYARYGRQGANMTKLLQARRAAMQECFGLVLASSCQSTPSDK